MEEEEGLHLGQLLADAFEQAAPDALALLLVAVEGDGVEPQRNLHELHRRPSRSSAKQRPAAPAAGSGRGSARP
jgi:hypothetical protein